MEAIELIKKCARVEYAEPNWIYNHFAVSNDTYFTNGSLWGMYGNTTSISICSSSAWANNKVGSATVYIGIIDEGYMYTHEDLVANAGKTRRIDNNGIDDDGNGLVDDVYGWDFAGNNNTVLTELTMITERMLPELLALWWEWKRSCWSCMEC
jgi:hypothetical protein